MKLRKRSDGLGVVGIGVAACAACCAGPILGVLAAAGLFTAAGFALFGALALLILIPVGAWYIRNRRQRSACALPTAAVPVDLVRRP